jgi:hypothetical protein
MNDIYAAIIGGVFLLLSPVVTLYLDRYFKSKKYRPIDVNDRRIVHGKWKGYFKQIFNGQEITVELMLRINVSSTGMIKGTANFTFENKRVDIKVNGGFYLRDFLKMNYYNSQTDIVQFGAFVFKINYQSKKLIGHFVGYGPKSEKVISGPANLEKQNK